MGKTRKLGKGLVLLLLVLGTVSCYHHHDLSPPGVLTHTVTFDSQGADTAATPSAIAATDNVETLPTDPVKAGKIFGGWFTEVDGGGTRFTASTPLTADITVYALWANAVAGTAQWAKAADNSSMFLSVATGPDNSAFSVGLLVGTGACTFGPGVTVSGPYEGVNALLVKYDGAGVAQWARTLVASAFDSRFLAVSVDADGSIYASGYFRGTDTFDFGNGVTFTGTMWENVVLVKYSSAGVPLWARGIGGAVMGSYFPYLAVVSRNGSIYVGGTIDNAATFDFGNGVTATGASTAMNAILVKFDSAGHAQWASTPSAAPAEGGTHIIGLALGADNTIYTATTIRNAGAYDFGAPGSPAAATGLGLSNAALVKYDRNGVAQWARTTTEGTDITLGGAVSVSGDNAIYLAGWRAGSSDVNFGATGNAGTTIAGTAGRHTSFLVRYDASGAAQWARVVATGASNSADLWFNTMWAGADGNVYVAGGYQGVANAYDFGNGVTLPAGTDFHALLASYDASGAARWVRPVGGGARSTSEYVGLTITPSGTLYAAGYSNEPGPYDFGNGVTVNPNTARNATLVQYK